MFLVPTYLKQSPIHGMGVYAASAIPANTVIWDFDPSVDWQISPEELEKFPEPHRSRFHRYCYFRIDGVYIFCGDNAKYMNHSPQPNCDDIGPHTITNRDIAPGEELTCNYAAFDHAPTRHEGVVIASGMTAGLAAGAGA